MLKNNLKIFIKSLLDLLYPPLCLHCGDALSEGTTVFCSICLEQMELIDPEMRCPLCFSMDDYSNGKKICETCSREDHCLNGVCSALDHLGPAATLVRRMKYSDQPYLAKGAAGYMAAQYCRMGWSLPDAIVPVPISRVRLLERGYNQCHLLACTLSEIFNKPILDVLQRRNDGLPHAGLNLAQRKGGRKGVFSVKKDALVRLHDKRLLLIDDVFTSGTTLRSCAEALWEGCPECIYGLTICRAIQ